MANSHSLTVVAANFLVIAGLIFYGFTLFAEYYAKGRWAKNVTGLLAGLGMLVLAAALLLVPQNADELARIAHRTDASNVFLGISSGLLLAAIAAFGVITYAKPLRLWHERKIEHDLSRGLPKIP
jgi:drug/metabolite transporter (DMT)-like permease